MSDRLKSLFEIYKKNPNDSFVTYGIALEYISTGNYDEAEKYLSEIITNDPDYVPEEPEEPDELGVEDSGLLVFLSLDFESDFLPSESPSLAFFAFSAPFLYDSLR